MIERVLAADFNFIGDADQISENSENTDLPTLVTKIVNILLFVAGALAIIYLIYSGILYISSAGNPDAAKKGQQGVLNAVIGLIIIVLAFFIARAVTGYASGVGGVN